MTGADQAGIRAKHQRYACRLRIAPQSSMQPRTRKRSTSVLVRHPAGLLRRLFMNITADHMHLGPSPGDAAVAQLVEQRIRNAWVGGSSPLCGTNIFNDLVAHNSKRPNFFAHLVLADRQLSGRQTVAFAISVTLSSCIEMAFGRPLPASDMVQISFPSTLFAAWSPVRIGKNHKAACQLHPW